jgi:hypothetical protein
VFYEDYAEVDGVKLPAKPMFYFWYAESGRQGDPKGTMTISDIAFVTPDSETFRKPQGAREDAMPGSQE